MLLLVDLVKYLCQWAKSLGVQVIGTVGSKEKIEIAKANGCHYVINYSKENFVEKVKKLTKNRVFRSL